MLPTSLTVSYVGHSPATRDLIQMLAREGAAPWLEPGVLLVETDRDWLDGVSAPLTDLVIFEPGDAALMTEGGVSRPFVRIVICADAPAARPYLNNANFHGVLLAAELSLQGVAHSIYTAFERQRLQAELVEMGESKALFSAHTLRHLMGNATDGIYMVDLVSKRVVYANFVEFLGYGASLWGAPGSILDVVHPLDQAVFVSQWAGIFSSWPMMAEAITAEAMVIRVQKHNGRWEWVEFRFDYVIGSDENAAAMIIVIMIVVTERKQTEDALRSYAQRMQLLHEIDRQILSTGSPDQVARDVSNRLIAILNANRVSVIIFNKDGSHGTILAIKSDEDLAVGVGESLSLERTLQYDELREGRPVLFRDLRMGVNAEIYSELVERGIVCLLIIPLLAQNQLIGLINVSSREVNAFTREDLDLVVEVARPLAIAIKQGWLYEQAEQQTAELRQREQFLTRLNGINQAMLGVLKLDEALAVVAEVLCDMAEASSCTIVWPAFGKRSAWEVVQFGERSAMVSAEYLLPLTDSLLDSADPVRSAQQPALTALNGIRLLGLPLLENDQRLGCVWFSFDHQIEDLTADVARISQAIGPIALAISKEQALQKEREQRQLAELLQNAATDLAATLDSKTIFDTVMAYLAQMVGFDKAVVFLIEEAQALPVSVSGFDDFDTALVYELFFSIADVANLNEVAQTAQSLIIPDVAQYPFWRKDMGAQFEGSWAGVPILVEGSVYAILSLETSKLDFFWAEDVAKIQALANQASLPLQKAQLYETVSRRLKELSVLHQVASAETALDDEDSFLEAVTAILGKTLYSDNFGILLPDPSLTYLVPHRSYRSPVLISDRIFEPVVSGIAYSVYQFGKPIRIADVRQDERYIEIDPRVRSEVCVPIVVDQVKMGVINAESEQLAAFTVADEQLLLTLAGQIGTNLQKIRLFKAEYQRGQEADTLRLATSVLTSTLDLPEVLETILLQLERVVDFDSATLMLHQDDSLVVKASRGFPVGKSPTGKIVPMGDALFEEVRRTHQAICLVDARGDLRFKGWGGTTHVRAWMGVPLLLRGKVIGMLTVDSITIGSYADAEIQLTQAFANQAAVALENARLYSAEQEARQTAVALHSASAALTQSLDLDQVMDALLHCLKGLIPFDSGNVVVLRGDLLAMVATNGYDEWSNDEDVKAITANITDNPTWNHVFIHKKSLIVANTEEYPTWKRIPATDYVRSWIGIPLIAGGKVIGAFSLDKAEPDFFTEAHVRLAETLAAQTAVTLQNALLYERLQQQADTLQQAVAERTRDLIQANDRLQELDRLKSKFVSDVSHELRTPIANLNLYLELLENGRPERRSHYLATIRSQTARLTQLIEDILNLSRLELVGKQVEMTSVDLNAVVEDLIPGHQLHAESVGLALEMTLGSPLPFVHGNAGQLAQVVMNLMANAINYTPSGTIRLTTKFDEGRQMVYLGVEDTGLGISAEDMAHLFERFYRGQLVSESNIPGTGLGLAIVKEVVDYHQGVIEVQSILNEGTAFHVWLPIVQAAPSGQ